MSLDRPLIPVRGTGHVGPVGSECHGVNLVSVGWLWILGRQGPRHENGGNDESEVGQSFHGRSVRWNRSGSARSPIPQKGQSKTFSSNHTVRSLSTSSAS